MPDVKPRTLPPATAPNYELLTLSHHPQHQPKPTVLREQVEPLYRQVDELNTPTLAEGPATESLEESKDTQSALELEPLQAVL